MLDRRRALKGGLAALGSLSVAAPFGALAQRKPAAKVRYNEVVRSMLYAPAYVAIAKGYFEEVGIEQTLSTAFGGDKSLAALLSNSADIALIGPETSIYVQVSEFADQDPDLLRAHIDRRLHAGRPREGRKFEWTCSRARRSSASARAARRSCSSKRRCARTDSIPRRT